VRHTKANSSLYHLPTSEGCQGVFQANSQEAQDSMYISASFSKGVVVTPLEFLKAKATSIPSNL
jgi:hypothetical protein